MRLTWPKSWDSDFVMGLHRHKQKRGPPQVDKPLSFRRKLVVALSLSLLVHTAVLTNGFTGLRRQYQSIVQMLNLPFKIIDVNDFVYSSATLHPGRSDVKEHLHQFGFANFNFLFLRIARMQLSDGHLSDGHYLNYSELLRPDLFRYPKQGYWLRLVPGTKIFWKSPNENFSSPRYLSDDLQLLGYIDGTKPLRWKRDNWNSLKAQDSMVWKDWLMLFDSREDVALWHGSCE